MFEDGLKEFNFSGASYPYKCDMVVLERIQQATGDLLKAENLMRGFVPKIDQDGVMDMTSGHKTLPDVRLVTDALSWMIEEGIEISGKEIKPLTAMDLKRQDEYTLIELSKIAYEEFENSLTAKKKKKTAAK